ncbi:hypothetical protein V8B97DRAFT_2023130 [Scleroderma yunnanense]
MAPSRSALSSFSHPEVDFIRHSSDNVDFRIFKIFLSLASPFFERLRTIDALLRFCYPPTLTPIPSLDHFKDVVNILEAAKKHSLDEVEKVICEAQFNAKILEVDSLHCFATIMATKYSLRKPLIPGWFEEIELVTAVDLLALLTYHQKCGSAVQLLHLGFSWIEQHHQNRNAAQLSHMCYCPQEKVAKLFNNQPALWWEEFMDATFQASKDKPCAHIVHKMTEKMIQQVRRHGCFLCPITASAMCEFPYMFAKEVLGEIISEKKLDRMGELRKWKYHIMRRYNIDWLSMRPY